MVANRRIFQDWTMSPPKSVSLVALLHDPRIIAAHNQAVQATLQELKTFAETRVRRDGNADGVRPTGNLVVACFRHETSGNSTRNFTLIASSSMRPLSRRGPMEGTAIPGHVQGATVRQLRV